MCAVSVSSPALAHTFVLVAGKSTDTEMPSKPAFLMMQAPWVCSQALVHGMAWESRKFNGHSQGSLSHQPC